MPMGIQTPLSPGGGPRLTRPSGQCGVGFDGGGGPPPRRCAIADVDSIAADATSASPTTRWCADASWLLLRGGLAARGGAERLAVGGRHGSRVRPLAAVAREASRHGDHIADLHRVTQPSALLQ